jgi:hypothetical protein
MLHFWDYNTTTTNVSDVGLQGNYITGTKGLTGSDGLIGATGSTDYKAIKD